MRRDRISKKAGDLAPNGPSMRVSKKMMKIHRKKIKKMYKKEEDWEDELPLEKMRRSFDMAEDLSATFTLPIKTRDGQVCLKRKKNTGKTAPVEQENTIKAENKAKDAEIKNPKKSDIKEKLASIAQKIIENPEENIGQLKTLYDMTLCSTIYIQRLGLLTQLVVYRDIIPGYSIRPLTEIEKASSVSKEIKKRRLFEESLVSNYYTYVSLLSKTIKGTKIGSIDD